MNEAFHNVRYYKLLLLKISIILFIIDFCLHHNEIVIYSFYLRHIITMSSTYLIEVFILFNDCACQADILSSL